ncbi:hypothetical protein CERSUDRAFT_110337 [Gelatoporia subvermispora B]|uniref:LIM zinc-binding domain-containing protein n=1 Tax=Ceriporiopsis subvermispora (strain B) TaxID=914234 RepID=M2QXA7_CERS8|nr:hypothetical protein CERSUDRAFT_110337 [Gelatoporia subvermispora B]
MGFCRRCGEIVSGVRCKCGGTAVAPVVKWKLGDTEQTEDRWSRTYVTKDKSSTTGAKAPASATSVGANVSSTSAQPLSRRFPRPQGSTSSTSSSLSSGVSDHIASTTSQPVSPMKRTSSILNTHSPSTAAAAGILPNPHGSELAKVYGSILQPKETLASYHCSRCATPFTPDATIYPEPSSLLSSDHDDVSVVPETRFLCRSCFTSHGGSRGECASCHRPVLILKSEGGFIENSGQVWHKKCFRCDGCSKAIGDSPMVDLLGRPSCATCFDSCLTRPNQNSPVSNVSSSGGEKRNNLGGIRRNSNSREGSPALEELEQRLGIAQSRQNTPITESKVDNYSSRMASPFGSGKVQTPLSARFSSPVGFSDTSPTIERLAARSRSDSSRSGHGDQSSPSSGTLRIIRPTNITSVRDGETYVRSEKARVADSDIFDSPTGVGARASRPSEDAITEMKLRLLRQASPGISSRVTSPTTTPTRPHHRTSDSRSLNRLSDLSVDSLTSAIAGVRSHDGRAASPPSFGTDARRSLREDSKGYEPEIDRFLLQPHRTGDAEVASLLGDIPSQAPHDLIDLNDPARYVNSSPSESSPVSNALRRPNLSAESGAARLASRLRQRPSRSSLDSDYKHSVPSTPDLAGNFSDSASTSESSGPSTPPSFSPPAGRSAGSADKTIGRFGVGSRDVSSRRSSDVGSNTPTPKSKTMPAQLTISSPTPLSSDARCARCHLPLFSTRLGGKFVTVPEESPGNGVPPKTYHTSCFTCKVCDKPFEERDGGRAVFVRGEQGACHVQCAPPERIKVRQIPSVSPRPHSNSVPSSASPRTTATATYHSPSSSSRYERPPPSAPATTTTFGSSQPRFGSSSSCPGCKKAVSPMEWGVVPGPHGTRWHAACLVCGGKEARGRRKDEGKPGCGKKLDSAARTDSGGAVWCRECLLLLPASLRQPGSPVRPLVPSHTGGHASGGVVPQYTGTTTIARQFTGVGANSDAALLRQLSGGGLSPTRQLSSSPTKMHDGARPGSVRRYPRPKSVTGIRSTKSEGEGRGMFLVRQLTGGSGGFSGNDYGL